MNFKTIIASAFIAASAMVAAPATAEMICDNSNGMRFCGTPGRFQDELTVTNQWGTEQIEITCANNRFNASSRGDWSQSQLEFFADSYCEGRGYNAHN